MFAFENWHSALEMKLYFQRFLHHIAGLPDFSALKFTRYNQYESLILPMQKYLEEAGVEMCIRDRDNYLLEGACYSFLIKKTSSKGGKIMKRKFLSVLLAGALAVSMLAGCGGGNDAAETTTETTDTAETDAAETDTADADAAETDASAGGGLVGVSMPTQDLQRWNQDGSNMKAEMCIRDRYLERYPE